jgi:hypothetical protein
MNLSLAISSDARQIKKGRMPARTAAPRPTDLGSGAPAPREASCARAALASNPFVDTWIISSSVAHCKMKCIKYLKKSTIFIVFPDLPIASAYLDIILYRHNMGCCASRYEYAGFLAFSLEAMQRISQMPKKGFSLKSILICAYYSHSSCYSNA